MLLVVLFLVILFAAVVNKFAGNKFAVENKIGIVVSKKPPFLFEVVAVVAVLKKLPFLFGVAAVGQITVVAVLAYCSLAFPH